MPKETQETHSRTVYLSAGCSSLLWGFNAGVRMRRVEEQFKMTFKGGRGGETSRVATRQMRIAFLVYEEVLSN
jgi:hypothetical protein